MPPPPRSLPVDPASPAHDARLAPVVALLASGELDVLSLDFFDTTCGRAVPRPVVAFRRVADELRAAGLVPGHVDSAAFVHVRCAAEARARRRRRDTTEVTLDEIYAEIPASLLPPENRDRARAVEVSVERGLAILDPSVAALAARAKALGVAVAIVSDTYLSAADLRAILSGAGATFVPDLVLTSSEERTCKCDGLFRTLLRRSGARPHRIAHVGDNLDADVAAARAAGLRAYHLPFDDDELRTVRLREGSLQVANAAEDAGLAYLRGRAARRAASAGPGLEGHFRLGATVFGPVFAAFAEWTVDRMEERGLDAALCFMREGEFLGALVEAAARARGRQLALRPFWISRQAAFRAAIGTLDAATLRAALVRRTAPTVADLCAGLGIAPEEAGFGEALARERLDREGLVARVFERLLEPACRARIERGARHQRALLVQHLAESLPASGAIACVDLGWGATIQRHLTAALRLEGCDREVVGLYLAATARASEAVLDGSEVCGFLASPGDHDALGELIARSPEVLEQLCLSPVGSTRGWQRALDGSARAVLEARGEDAAGDRERAAVRAGIACFQAQLLALRRPSHGRFAIDELRGILARFLAHPLANEAALVGRWHHDDNFGSSDAGRIAPRLAPEALSGRSAAELYWDRSVYWPAGTAVQASAQLAEELAGYALLGLFGPGGTPAQQSAAAPARYQLVDRLELLVRTHAPTFHRAASALAARAGGPVDPPLRYRVVDALNAYVKRVAPSVHARSKVAAVGALHAP